MIEDCELRNGWLLIGLHDTADYKSKVVLTGIKFANDALFISLPSHNQIDPLSKPMAKNEQSLVSANFDIAIFVEDEKSFVKNRDLPKWR